MEADIIATGPISRQIFVIDKGIVFKTRARDRVIGLVNNKAAPRGYAYLLITKGYGCLSSILFDRFDEIHTCFAEAQRLFLNMVDVDIQEPHAVGGVGSFSTVPLRQKRRGVVAGEAAGIQDMLWGFGIKNALISGFMAAKSILDQEDYGVMAGRFFGDKMKASIVNRFIWETFGRDGYSFLLRLTAGRKDPLHFLYLTHQFTVLHRLLYPLAVNKMRQRYPHLKM
jgi:flavin-dependent dehydrogenase